MTTTVAANADKTLEKRRALGRGLDSLLPSGPRVVESGNAGEGARATHSGVLPAVHAQAARGDSVVEVPLELIDENPYQTRYFAKNEPISEDFVATSLDELADSIRANGVIQPISVRPGTEGRYVLILGERRCRASKIAGKTTIPAIVRKVSDQQAAEMTVVENLQRQDLNCMEQAEAFSKVEPGFQADARADWAAGGDLTGVGFELHAVVAATASGCGVFAGREIGIQRGARAFDLARSEHDSEDRG
jgi:ParB family transcriptional regulator, chromosome partitioning protein